MCRFDSIDALNTEELLVKRKKGSKKYVIGMLVASGSFLIIGVLIGYFSAPRDSSNTNGAGGHYTS